MFYPGFPWKWSQRQAFKCTWFILGRRSQWTGEQREVGRKFHKGFYMTASAVNWCLIPNLLKSSLNMFKNCLPRSEKEKKYFSLFPFHLGQRWSTRWTLGISGWEDFEYQASCWGYPMMCSRNPRAKRKGTGLWPRWKTVPLYMLKLFKAAQSQLQVVAGEIRGKAERILQWQEEMPHIDSYHHSTFIIHQALGSKLLTLTHLIFTTTLHCK